MGDWVLLPGSTNIWRNRRTGDVQQFPPGENPNVRQPTTVRNPRTGQTTTVTPGQPTQTDTRRPTDPWDPGPGQWGNTGQYGPPQGASGWAADTGEGGLSSAEQLANLIVQQGGPRTVGDVLRYAAQAGVPVTQEQAEQIAAGTLPGMVPSGQTGPAPTAADQPTVDFMQRVRALFPGWPEAILTLLADHWDETGDLNLALALTRQNRQLYEQWLPGIFRDDGTLRMSEAEYAAVRDGFRQVLAEEGVDPSRVEHRFADWIRGDVSVAEARERLGIVRQGIIQQGDSIRQAYREFFGPQAEAAWDLSDEALFVHAVDPQLGMEVLSRRVSLAQIGGNAARFGFRRSLGRVTELANAGLSAEQAQQFYGQAASQVPTFETLSRRYRDDSDPFGIEDLEDALVFLNPGDRRQAESLLQQERSRFSPRGGFSQGRDGGLSGLVRR